MLLDQLKGKLIVSCQALPDEPLHSSYIMSRMAVAAKQGGAAGIRAQSVEDINAIMEVCDLPMIGIIKRNYPDSDIYITATKKEIDELLGTKCQIIALDATDRPRPNGEKTEDLVAQIHAAGRLAMADCSTYEECVKAQEMGFDMVSTFSALAACINNIGPGLEIVGPMGNFTSFSWASKLLLSFNMLVGRLEIFPMLLLFAPSIWKRRAVVQKPTL